MSFFIIDKFGQKSCTTVMSQITVCWIRVCTNLKLKNIAAGSVGIHFTFWNIGRHDNSPGLIQIMLFYGYCTVVTGVFRH